MRKELFKIKLQRTWKSVVFVITKHFGYKADTHVKVKRSVFN